MKFTKWLFYITFIIVKKISFSQLFTAQEYLAPLLSSRVKKNILGRTIGRKSLMHRIVSYAWIGTLMVFVVVFFLGYNISTPMNKKVTTWLSGDEISLKSPSSAENISFKTDDIHEREQMLISEESGLADSSYLVIGSGSVQKYTWREKAYDWIVNMWRAIF